jgi:uncharacterized membrane-anchored protein YjiN (DUF445 family)
MKAQNYTEMEKAKIKQFRCEAKDIIDEVARKVMDEVQEELKPATARIKEVAERAAAALKAFVESAPFDDEHLKAALNESFDKLPDVMEIFIDAAVRRAVKKTFETIRLDIDEKTNMALEGLDLLAEE